jgi:hypothetical protein
MNCTVAVEAQAGEVLERIVRLVFVDVMQMYGDLAVWCSAGFAFASSKFPSLQRITSVAFEQAVLLLRWILNSSTLLFGAVFVVPFHRPLSAFIAIETRDWRLRRVTFDAAAIPLASFALVGHPLAISLKTRDAQRRSWLNVGATASALSEIFPDHRSGRVLVNAEFSGNLSGIADPLIGRNDQRVIDPLPFPHVDAPSREIAGSEYVRKVDVSSDVHVVRMSKTRAITAK